MQNIYDPNKHCRTVIFVSVNKNDSTGSFHNRNKYKECALLHWNDDFFIINTNKLETVKRLPIEIHKQFIETECNFQTKKLKSIVNWCVNNQILIKEEVEYKIVDESE